MTQTDIKPFTKEDLEKADVQLLRDGRWGNARVSVANINGKRWTIKDFSDRRLQGHKSCYGSENAS